jgi:hypothetical protein
MKMLQLHAKKAHGEHISERNIDEQYHPHSVDGRWHYSAESNRNNPSLRSGKPCKRTAEIVQREILKMFVMA